MHVLSRIIEEGGRKEGRGGGGREKEEEGRKERREEGGKEGGESWGEEEGSEKGGKEGRKDGGRKEGRTNCNISHVSWIWSLIISSLSYPKFVFVVCCATNETSLLHTLETIIEEEEEMRNRHSLKIIKTCDARSHEIFLTNCYSKIV